MLQLFTIDSPYKKWARSFAIAWTLLIFIACLTPAKEIPHVDVPFIDKWTHLVLFGVFAFLWLCARPVFTVASLIRWFFITAAFGIFIELMQGYFTSLGRSMELMDGIADAAGGALGIGLFILMSIIARKK